MQSLLLPRMIAQYESLVREAESTARSLNELKKITSAVEYMISEGGLDVARYKAIAQRLLEYIDVGRFDNAVEEAGNLCRSVSKDYVLKLLDTDYALDGGRIGCMGRGAAELLLRVVKASGPLAHIVRALLAAGGGGLEENLYTVVREWQRLSKVLASIYRSSVMLERNVGVKRLHVISLAAALAEKTSLKEALASLEHIASVLGDAAILSKRSSQLVIEASKALANCNGDGSSTACKLLHELLSHAMASKNELEALRNAGSSIELVERVRRAREELEKAEKVKESISRLASRLVKTGVDELAAMIASIESFIEQEALSREEQEVLLLLAEGRVFDIVELKNINQAYPSAALALCMRGLAHCRVSL